MFVGCAENVPSAATSAFRVASWAGVSSMAWLLEGPRTGCRPTAGVSGDRERPRRRVDAGRDRLPPRGRERRAVVPPADQRVRGGSRGVVIEDRVLERPHGRRGAGPDGVGAAGDL